MADEEDEHMIKRYNLRPRPTCKKVKYTTVSYSRSLKRTRKHTLYPHTHDQKELYIPYLSPEIIFNILVYLPADMLYNVMRYVCREWHNIISSPNFIDAHLLKTDRGLLIKQYVSSSTCSVEMEKNDNIRIAKVSPSLMGDYYGMASCNGLVLIAGEKIRYVANLVTKKGVTLPPPGGKSDLLYTSIGYTQSKKYKLVEFFTNHHYAMECGILTVGVDREWRSLFQVIDGGEIEKFHSLDFWSQKPIVSAQGILHVIHNYLPLVFNLDLETETFYTRALPKCSDKNSRTYMATGQSLCFMDYLGKFSWEMWLLKDAESGEWSKLAFLDLACHEQMLRQSLCPIGFAIVPVGFLKDGEVVVFHVVPGDGRGRRGRRCMYRSRICVTYNVKTGGINSFQLDGVCSFAMDEVWMYIPYVKSLVSLKFGAN